MPSAVDVHIAVAPMIDWTNRHFRALLRLIAPKVWLYTEMIVANAIVQGKRANELLRFHDKEHPLALQLGGSDPKLLKEAAIIGESFGYDAINLNVGCPSPRVASGRFGACLMLEPECVADCIAAMQGAVSIPVTIKCRLGVDEQEDFAFLHQFIETTYQAGCKSFIIHARKAWLKGLSPKQNREIPPLRYDIFLELKEAFSHIPFILNGGLKTIAQLEEWLPQTDGCMIGRIVCESPYFLKAVDEHFFNGESKSRLAIALQYIDYMDNESRSGTRLTVMTRYLLNLFHGESGASIFRRFLSENMHKENFTLQKLHESLKYFNQI